MFAGLTLGKAAAAIGIKGFAALGALIMAGVFWIGWTSAANDRDKARSELAHEEARHAVTRQSVGFLTLEIDRFMAAAKAREAEFNAAKVEAERDKARLAAKAKASDAKIARLLAIPAGTCPAPADLLEELEGL
ncbi:MAG: hypothetical protein NUV75_00615 [Gallionella sp.]|nr:hypothetical protein [Gallionella sp.]